MRATRGGRASRAFRARSGTRSAWVEVDGAQIRPTQRVKPGSWPLFATFDGGPTSVRAGTVEIVAGETTTLECNARHRRCVER